MGQSSAQVTLGPGNMPEEISVLVYIDQLQQNARFRLMIGNVEAPVVNSDMNEHMIQFVLDLTSFTADAGDASELVIEVFKDVGDAQVTFGEIVVVADGGG